MMNEFIAALLQAVLIAAVPVCAAIIGNGIKALADYLGQKSESDEAKRFLVAVADAVSTAVTYTSQTYSRCAEEVRRVHKREPGMGTKGCYSQS